MKTPVLFVQGAGAGAHAADAKLASSLQRSLGSAFKVRYPHMPKEGDPDPAAWKRRLAREIVAMGDGAILVAHSAGAPFLAGLLAERTFDRRIAGLFLVSAPFCGTGGWDMEGCRLPAQLERRLPSGLPVFLYHGRDDETVPVAHARLYRKALPHAVVRRLEGRNHQLNDDLSEVAADIAGLPRARPRRA